MCVPSRRCPPAQSRQMKTPKVDDAQIGFRCEQSKQTRFSAIAINLTRRHLGVAVSGGRRGRGKKDEGNDDVARTDAPASFEGGGMVGSPLEDRHALRLGHMRRRHRDVALTSAIIFFLKPGPGRTSSRCSGPSSASSRFRPAGATRVATIMHVPTYLRYDVRYLDTADEEYGVSHARVVVDKGDVALRFKIQRTLYQRDHGVIQRHSNMSVLEANFREESIHALGSPREMIARPTVSQIEPKLTEEGAWQSFVSSSRRDHFVIAVARLLEPQLVMHSDIIVYRNLTLNDVMYIVETGYVVLFGADPTRTERVVVCRSNDSFGDDIAMNVGGLKPVLRQFTAKAKRKTRLFTLGSARFNELLDGPTFSIFKHNISIYGRWMRVRLRVEIKLFNHTFNVVEVERICERNVSRLRDLDQRGPVVQKSEASTSM